MIWLPKIKLINIINIVKTCDDIHENTFMTLLNYKYKKKKVHRILCMVSKKCVYEIEYFLFINTNTKTA